MLYNSELVEVGVDCLLNFIISYCTIESAILINLSQTVLSSPQISMPFTLPPTPYTTYLCDISVCLCRGAIQIV